MDPFGDSGELFNIQRSFYTGDYQGVLDTDTSSFKENNKVYAQVLSARARIALGRAQDVVSELQGSDIPDLSAAHCYAEYINGAKEIALSQLDKLVSEKSDNHQVEFLCGLILTVEQRYEEALKLLLKHQGSLECIALIVQIYLLQNDLTKAEKEVENAKKWAQDNIVFNLAESWVELRKGGEASCQSAFYIYEELCAGMQQTSKSLNGKAVCSYIQPQRTDNLDKVEKEQLNEQREGPLVEASSIDPNNADILANLINNAIILGKDYSDYESKLEQADKTHPSLVDLQEKATLFDKIIDKYQVA